MTVERLLGAALVDIEQKQNKFEFHFRKLFPGEPRDCLQVEIAARIRAVRLSTSARSGKL